MNYIKMDSDFSDSFLIAEVFQESLFLYANNKNCKHTNIKILPNCESFCSNCGLSFTENAVDVENWPMMPLTPGDFDQRFSDDVYDNKSKNKIVEKEKVIEDEIECEHENIIKDDSGVMICSDCGIEINNLDFSQEW